MTTTIEISPNDINNKLLQVIKTLFTTNTDTLIFKRASNKPSEEEIARIMTLDEYNSKLEEGEKDIIEGRVYTHKQAKQRIEKWIKMK